MPIIHAGPDSLYVLESPPVLGSDSIWHSIWIDPISKVRIVVGVAQPTESEPPVDLWWLPQTPGWTVDQPPVICCVVGPPPPVIGPPQSNVPEPNPFAVITLVLITAITFRKLRRGVVC
jgi:hypothetical protein